MRTHIWAVILSGLAAFGQDILRPGDSVRGGQRQSAAVVTNNYIVEFAPGNSRNDRANAASAAGASIRYLYNGVSAMAVTAPNQNALEALRRNPRVTQISPVRAITTQAKPPGAGGGNGGGNGGGSGGSCCSAPGTFDTRQVISFEVQRVGLPTTTSDGHGIGIAVLDTGIDFNHTDLAPSGSSFSSFPGTCQDDGGHGTHVSGMIAALNNSIAIVGVAPAAKLYCVKVLTGALTGDDATVMAGLDWVLDNHATVTPPIRVVNMSLGRPLEPGETLASHPIRALIQALYNQGVVVVASAGNEPALEVTSMVPAGFPEVISVSSTTATEGVKTCSLFGLDLNDVLADTASGFTTDGSGVTIAAPGEQHTDIVVLGSLGCAGLEYGTLSTTAGSQSASRKVASQAGVFEARGTSFAAPLVSGVVARVLQLGLVPVAASPATVEGVRTWIQTNANRKGVAPLDHPWASVIYDYTFDGVREGIVQAPR